jgi:hypothetical protein
VAVGAGGDLRIEFAFFKVTDKTGAFGDGNMLALNDLGMAAGASQFFASLQVGEVDFVVKDNRLIFDLSLEKSFVMASFAEAAFIGDLGPGPGFQIEFGPVSPQLHQSFDLRPEERP